MDDEESRAAFIDSGPHTTKDGPLPPVVSAVGKSLIAGNPVAGMVEHQPYNDSPRVSFSSKLRVDDEERRAAFIDPGPHAIDNDPLPPVVSAVGRSPTDGKYVAGMVEHQPHNDSPPVSFSSTPSANEGEGRAAFIDSGSESDPDAVREVAVKKNPGTERGSIEGIAKMSTSASEREAIEETAKEGDSKIPVGYENTGIYLPGSVIRYRYELTISLQ